MYRRLSVALLLLSLASPAAAQADWIITPFLGASFGSDASFLIFETGTGRKLTLGGSVALVGRGILGVEADIGHTQGFFEGSDPLGLVLTSRVTTFSGNVLVTAPLALTRESLRPYIVGGLGLLQARSTDAANLFPVKENMTGLTVGVGAVGLLNERTGLRFDLRHIKAVGGARGALERPVGSRLRFWRATVGVSLHY